MYLYKNKSDTRKNNGTFKGKQRNNVNKAEQHPLSSVAVEISSPRNQSPYF